MTAKSNGFDIEFELDGARIRVVGTISPGYPATGPTYSCGGEPGEPPHVEEYQVLGADGREIPDEGQSILDIFEGRIIEAWQQQLWLGWGD